MWFAPRTVITLFEWSFQDSELFLGFDGDVVVYPGADTTLLEMVFFGNYHIHRAFLLNLLSVVIHFALAVVDFRVAEDVLER